MISRIEAHNYRCFPKFVINLDRYHGLVGADGAGKTTLPDIPVLLGDILQHQPDFGKLIAAMSVRQCQDAAFIQLRHYLRAWSPEQP